jgi:Zn-dependent metalloprotease
MTFNTTAAACLALMGSLQCAEAFAAPQGTHHPAVARALAAMKDKRQAAAAVAQNRVNDRTDERADDLDDDDELTSTDVVVDPNGQEHVRFSRRYKGLRVVGGDMVVHGNDRGQLKSLSRTWQRRGRLDVQSNLSEAQADTQALRRFPHAFGRVSSRELIVWAVDGQDAPAWDVVVDGQQADGTPSTMHHIIHAGSGKPVAQWDEVHTTAATATGQSLYSGLVSLGADLLNGTYSLKDASRGGHYVADASNKLDVNFFGVLFPAKQTLVTSTSSNFGNGVSSNRASAAADAAYGFTMTWDYFRQVHGRNGIDGAGRKVYSRVHYGSNYNNAFWQGTCFCMTYGDGDGTSMKSLISMDVAGHEMAHGVTATSAKLIYTGESGGLNEGTSDIFGAMVEHFSANGTDVADYLIGERIVGSKITRGYLRNMVNPSDDGASADCWHSGVGKLDVHLSSGVTNHLFYLLAEGTTGGQPSRTCRSTDARIASGSDTVQGVGRQKAERIWYRALTVYMTSSTNFAGARQATIKAATDLHGANAPEVAAVMAAWSAVNVN